jgi:hypothetical protein
MAALMDGRAARDPEPRLRAEWTSMAAHWRSLAHQADWQDSYAPQSP